MDKKTKVYTLKQAQAGQPIKSQDESDSRVEDHSKVQIQTNPEGINEDVYRQLHKNPFYVIPKSIASGIHSIEDFYIDIKKTTMPMGVVLRGDQFSPKKRKRYIKKAFKKWKQGFYEQKDRITFDSEKSTAGEGFSLHPLSVFNYLSLAFTVFLITFLVFFSGRIWTSLKDKKWFAKVLSTQEVLLGTSWFVRLSSVVVYLAIAGFLYVSVYNLVLRDLIKMDKTRSKLMSTTIRKMDKEFLKRYQVTSRYYLRRVGKRKINFSPLPIDKTMIKKVDLEELEQLHANYIKKASKVKKRKFLLLSGKFLFVYLTYLGGAGIIGYYVYSIIKKLI